MQLEPFHDVAGGHLQRVPSKILPPVQFWAAIVGVGTGAGCGVAWGILIDGRGPSGEALALADAVGTQPDCSTPSDPVQETSVKPLNDAFCWTVVPCGTTATV